MINESSALIPALLLCSMCSKNMLMTSSPQSHIEAALSTRKLRSIIVLILFCSAAQNLQVSRASRVNTLLLQELHQQRNVSLVGSPRIITAPAAAILSMNLGSSPPTCTRRCGNCNPCKGVLVPIHTSRDSQNASDYYPLAWRCQCGGHLFTP